ncbi:MAG: hypothetical protein V1929_01100 [bacterium]
MKNAVLAACILLSLAVLVSGQEKGSPYDRMISLSKEGLTDESLRSFVASLSKEDFKRLVIEYRLENIPSPQVNVFGGMSMLSILYYEHGAGQNDGYEEWATDVADRSYPAEWRNIILADTPSKARPQSTEQKKDYQALLRRFVVSEEEMAGIRREALLRLEYESLSAAQFSEFTRSLEEIVTTPDQHPGLFQTALREIDHVIDSGKETAAKGPAPAIAKAIAAGDVAAVAGDKNLPAEQKHFFTQVAELSKDFGAILENLSSTTNLPNYLQNEVRKLKDKRSAASSF